MKSKIEWYREVLELEPQSKVFFPLARLLIDSEELEAALSTLEQGLARHPEFVEAKLLLAEVLDRLGREQELDTLVQKLSDSMSEYPAFWEAWARQLDTEEEGQDPAMAMRFLAAWFAGRRLSWSGIIQAGLSALLEEQAAAPPVPDALLEAADMARRASLQEQELEAESHPAEDTTQDRSPEGGGSSTTTPAQALVAPEADATAQAAPEAQEDSETEHAPPSGHLHEAAAPRDTSQTHGAPAAGPVPKESLESLEEALAETRLDASETQGPAALIEQCEDDQTAATIEGQQTRHEVAQASGTDGSDKLQEDTASGGQEHAAEAGPQDGEEEEEEGEEETFSLRTRTMADLLAEQGDYEGALDIYRELLAMNPAGKAREELEDLVDSMRRLAGEKSGPGNGGRGRKTASKQQQDTSKGLKGKTKLISALESLAQRLEAKAAH